MKLSSAAKVKLWRAAVAVVGMPAGMARRGYLGGRGSDEAAGVRRETMRCLPAGPVHKV
ncbi:MAG: hypothetical protein ACLQA5_13000 [Solirubrobacteraceae bacterium]